MANESLTKLVSLSCENLIETKHIRGTKLASQSEGQLENEIVRYYNKIGYVERGCFGLRKTESVSPRERELVSLGEKKRVIFLEFFWCDFLPCLALQQ